MSKAKVAVIQLCSKADKAANFAKYSGFITEAATVGCSMAFLPEAFDFIGSNVEMTLRQAEPVRDGPLMRQLQKIAKESNIWLSLGGFHELGMAQKEDNRMRISNSHVIINSAGEIVTIYRKIHLFDAPLVGLKESNWTSPGGEITDTIETPAGPLAPSICYDLRFPQMAHLQRRNGAQILTYPSAFTVPTGKAHWEVLLRSRAIETQCWVIAAAQVGNHNEKRASYGHSMVVDPWGEVRLDMQDEIGFRVVEIDQSITERVRSKMPVFDHFRRDLY